MTLSYFRICLLGFLFVLYSAKAQDNTALLWENEIDVNTMLSEIISLNLGTAYRNEVSEGITNSAFTYTSKHLQLSSNISVNVGFYGKISGGAMYRFNTVESAENENELRLTQQYSYGKKFNELRVVHRMQLDQRILSSETVWRIRYRFSGDMPLNGLKLDTGEFYLVVSTESLFNVSEKTQPEWDQRFTVGLGNQVTRKIKLQLDTEYRIEDYYESANHRLFIVTGFIYNW